MDNYESAPPHSECEITQAVLSGTSSLTWFSLPHAKAHWDKCLECQSRFPEGIAEGKRALEENIKASIARTYHAFMSKKHSLSAGAGNSDASILIELAQCAEDIQWDLGFIHAVLDGYFWVLPENEYSGIEGDVHSYLAPFIRSLDTKAQHFVFSAILASEIFKSLPKEAELISETNDIKEQSPREWEGYRLISENVNSSALLSLIDKAALIYLQEYLRKTKTRRTELVQGQKETISSMVLELRRDVKNDLRESLAAIRTETLQLYESEKSSAASYEPTLRKELTSEIYDHLAPTTQRSLQLAEYFYRLNNEPDGFASVVNQLAKAYEYEFHKRITEIFTADLLRQGTRSYPQSGDRQLIRQGKASARSIGDVVYYLKTDVDMKSFLVRNRLDPFAIACDAENVTKIRNPIAHDSEGNIGHVETLRKLLLNGKHSIFAHLIPSDECF